MKKISLNAVLVAIILFFISSNTSCSKEKCDYSECAIIAPSAEIQSVQNYLSSNGLTAVQHCSGLFYNITQAGSGKHPNFCNTVDVNYVGKLTNGTVFDQGNNSSFRLDEVITGFRNGIPQVKEGGKIILYVPPSLGYGSRQVGSIPPNSILVFTVDLLDAE